MHGVTIESRDVADAVSALAPEHSGRVSSWSRPVAAARLYVLSTRPAATPEVINLQFLACGIHKIFRVGTIISIFVDTIPAFLTYGQLGTIVINFKWKLTELR